ncbi:FIST C-terminal domain-containing protein [Shewanella corallii]|uniref:FIST C-terminal domain-containing protein n=1 Tax=Shewanella corallii TaxID=560080 RepID=A0ABT0N2T5_9GAMM|nr:nitric oxide-sensing protein NosP [Shewanella corallii]MCL2912754.1 FIST C-terminal domain-containing protein [Shewanella corallii]
MDQETGKESGLESPLIEVASSIHNDAAKAAAELAAGLDRPDLEFVLFFCSASYDLPELAKEMESRFVGRKVVGCTTSGEITERGYSKNSILALGFSNRAFTLESELLPLDNFSLNQAQACVAELVNGCNQRGIAPVAGNSFVLTLIDGLSPKEELFLAILNAALGKIPHFGGSAGDDVNLAYTHVYCNGSFHSDSAVVVMVNTICPFEVFTTHHIKSLDQKLVVTEADSDKRRVYELNAEPAALVYAREAGLPLEELQPEVYALHPLAVLIGGEYYIRSIQKVNDDLSLDFYCAVDCGIVLTAMEPGDLYTSVEAKLTELQQQFGETEMVLGCDCFLRELESDKRDLHDKLSRLYKRFRLVGFNTYGEQLNGVHMNQTLTGVMIGKPGSQVLEDADE